MAIRYCGQLRIRLTYRDHGDYRCVVSAKGERAHVVYVGPPASGFGSGVAYDSPEAYDQTASAAVSFATADINDLEALTDIKDAGVPGFSIDTWDIRRTKGSR